jgi:S1-C subfamily serine protease
LVLTNNHVLREDKEFTIQTHDGATYPAKPVNNAIQSNDDLALLEFTSEKSYQTATINSSAIPIVEQDILAVGYAAETGKLVTQEGKIGLIPDKTFKDGYSVGYSSNIVQGMSGGAILNVDGEVIGINGKSAFPIVNTGYVYQDGSEPTAEEIEQYRQLSWGLSLNSFLAQLNSDIITAYNLPLPETVDKVNAQLTGWLGELEAKAKQITVRIDSSSGANGSGVIIAKEGNSYTVLTADHVICEKDKETRECIDYTYEILAPDGKTYPVEASTITRQEGVDLAVVKFTSNKNYQVAQLANYPVTRNDAVFVAGYPRL